MRWLWLDRFTEFTSGQSATAIKNVTLAEEPLHGYRGNVPYFPASLIVEGMAQVGGLLVAQLSDFRNRVVLAKLGKSKFYFQVGAGQTMTYRAEILNLQEHGAVVAARSTVEDHLQAEVEIMFAYLGDRFQGVELFDPADFCRSLRAIRLFEVGRNPDGSPIQVPGYMLEAEGKTGEQP